jgi:3',5'-cyclic AMP phosphodiesterase CpdA
MKDRYFAGWLLIVALLFTGCRKTFEYSPFSGETLKEHTGLRTEANIQELRNARSSETGAFKVAFLADTHYFMDELEEAIKQINAGSDIDFVVIAGDMSDQGLTKEYIQFYDLAKQINKPVFTVIGNHDYLANAEDIYADMFGAVNYTLDHRGYRFIFFDNIFWEKNATPDFNWLNEQASAANASGMQPVLISHIPFFGDQYDSASRRRHTDIVAQQNIKLSVHGHQHSYSYTPVDENNDAHKCLVVPAVGKRSYCVVSFDGDKDPVVNSVNF